MSSDQQQRQQNSCNRNRNVNFYNSNDSRNPNAPSSSSTTTNRRNNGNGRRSTDRETPSMSRPSVNSTPCVYSVMAFSPMEDDGWGEPDPTYWEKKERQQAEKERMRNFYKTGVYRQPQHLRARRMIAQGASRPMANGLSSLEVIPQADWEPIEPQMGWGIAPDGDYDDYGRVRDRSDDYYAVEAQSASEIVPTHEFHSISFVDLGYGTDKDSGVAERDASDRFNHFRRSRKVSEIVEERREEKEQDEDTSLAILKVYRNDLLMETIISNITQLSDRSLVEMASKRMFNLSKNAPYRFSKGGDHLHIHFTTFDDFATIQYGSVVRTVPILTMDTRRFDKMESRMTIALKRILENIGSRFARKVRKITLGGTTEFYSARGVPDHHLIVTHDFLSYLLHTFGCVSSLHLINCGIDDGAIDLCDTPLWKDAMARMESIELRTVWADTPNRLPFILNSISDNLEQFTLTRFTCRRMGAAMLDQLKKANCRLKEMELVIDEDSAEDHMELYCLLKEVASRTESLRITVAEIGDGSQQSPKCFSFLSRLRDIPNLTELKVYVQPKNTGQFEAMVTLFRDFEFLTSLRTLHIEGFIDQNWLTTEMIYNLADAFRAGMNYLEKTLEDVSFANFPKPTKYNVHGFRGDRKEGAYESLWESMASSIGTRKTKRLSLTSVRLEDKHLMRIYKSINKVAEEVYLKNIRRVTAKSVTPLVNGEFPRLRKLEAEIAVEPLVLYNLGEIDKMPDLQYAKFALKRRISDDDHHTKMLRTLFSGVFLDQESPRGPLKQFVEVHHRIPGAKRPPPFLEAESAYDRMRPANNRAPRPFDYRTAGYGNQSRRQPPKLLYGEWE